jgi:hypothetical protein
MAEQHSPDDQRIRQIVREEIQENNALLRADIRGEIRAEIQANNAVIMEAMRDMQTELLRGMERFARGNFSRMHRLETSDNDLNERINVLEERVTALETKPPRK